MVIPPILLARTAKQQIEKEEKKRKQLEEKARKAEEELFAAPEVLETKPLTETEKQAIIEQSKKERPIITEKGIFKGGQFFPLSRQELAREQITKPLTQEQIPQTTVEQELQAAKSQVALELFNKFKGQPLPKEILAALTPTEIDQYQALATGGFGAGAGAIGGAITGAVAGSAGAGIGTIPGAAIGLGIGVLQGVRSNIGNQISGEILARKIELSEGEANLRTIISDINSGGNPIQDTELFFKNVVRIRIAHERLKLDTQRDLAKFTGKDGTPELARYRIFFDQTLPLLERELEQSLLNPNPNKILVTQEEISEE
jgi:hypothetical protein